MTYYKFLKAGAISPFQGFQWTVGEWVDTGREPVDFGSGLYGCTQIGVSRWIDAELYEIEYAGRPIGSDCGSGKVFGRRARLVRRVDGWDQRTARLVAADFAEHVAHLWVPPAGVAWVPADTIRVVRQYADGLVSKESLLEARARAADAAEAAAAAARVSGAARAAWAADAADAAEAAAAAAGAWGEAAAWAARAADAAEAAAWAARGAARAATTDRSMEQEWQSKRLLEMVGEL